MSSTPPDPIAALPASADRRAHFRREADAGTDHLARLFAHIPDGLVCLDRNWLVTYVNAEGARIARLQPRDLRNRTHWEIFPETLGTELERIYRDVMQTRAPRHFENFYPPFDLWTEIHVLPTDEGIALFFRDITSRKRAEAGHDEAGRQMQQIFDAAPDAILCLDPNWICTFANRAAHHLLKARDLVGANLLQRFPALTGEPFRSNYLATMQQRTPTEFEAYYPKPLDVWFRVLVRPYEDGIVLFLSDITDRKGAELLRDNSARQLRQVLETTTDAVLSVDRDWNYTFLNPRAKELLSIKGELLGKNLWHEFPAAQTSPEISFHFHRAMDRKIESEFEAFYPEPLNLWLSFQCRPFDDGVVFFFRDVTARHQSVTVLKQQQDLLAAVQHAARVATWDVDFLTGQVTYGPGSYPVFGHPLTGIPHFGAFKKILVPEYLPIIQNCAQAAVETGQRIVQEFQVKAADGTLLWLESRGQAVFRDGKPTHIRGLTIDIGKRKKNEEALVASEARYRVLADLNPQAIWMGDANGEVTYANQKFLDYLGLPIESISSLGWLNAFAPEDQARVLDQWTHSVATGEEYNVEARLLRARDGDPRWWSVRAQPVRNPAGTILHWLGVAIDIHDSRLLAQTLLIRQQETERQRAELETLYHTAPIGLALFDPVDFRYLRLNERQAEIIGLPHDQILGRTLTEIAPIEGLHEMFQQVASGHPILNELLQGELPSRPGEHRFWTVNYLPVYRSDGTIQAISAASIEITSQKKAEAALVQSEKLAAVGRLASSISHEINNPLEAITNLLYIISHSPELAPGLERYVHTAQDELSRVCQIATQTLRFHRQAVRATEVTAADLLDPVLQLYQGRLTNSGINVQVCYSTHTPILCLENDIRQVLNNLIANAIDAMRRGGGRLLVRAHDASLQSPSPSGQKTGSAQKDIPGIRITIADTGHGMSPAVQSRLFEPFYTTKELNGTGLGLWISAGIVSRHQGRLTLRSTEHPTHHGTIFSLFLPRAEVPTLP
ncbi:MAG: PAS domain-containing protein [Acidobacteriota bacterium]|nr:PAS domain-containing protein [Acidobacteriota bacterium]